jgi:uncharacterized repeat protein (TIGR02543 family)
MEAVPATKAVTEPATAIDALPTPPLRTDYVFTGWNTLPDGMGIAFTEATTVSSSITVYAQWIYSYTVTFDKNGGTTEAVPPTKTVASPATTIDSLPAPPSRTGYLFGGWYTLPNGGGTAFTETATVSASITVYAQWDAYSYTVTFDRNGGTTAANPPTKTVASPATTIDALPASPARSGGYTFTGWNAAPDGSGTIFTAMTTVNGDITVYARWGRGYGFDIILNLDIGDGVFSETGFTLSKSGTGHPNNRTIAITGTDYANPRWFVDGTPEGTGTNITITAANYGAGGHTLTLFVSKSGVTWSKEITFTITN